MTKGPRSILLPIILIVIVDVLAFTMILPLLPFYAEHFGATPFEVGMLTGSFALASLIAGPVLGRWSDLYGRRRVLLVSQGGTLAGLLIAAWAPTLAWLFVGRIVAGLTAGNLSVAQATIADVTEPAKRARNFGLIGAAFGLGFLIGPAISAVLVKAGLIAPLLGAAALTVVSMVFTMLMIPAKTRVSDEAEPPSMSRSEIFRRPGLPLLLVQFFGYVLSFSTFTSGLALFMERRYTWHGQPFHVAQVGWALAAVGLWGLLVQGGLIRPLLKRFGERKLVTIGFSCMAIGFGLLAPSVLFGVGGLTLFAIAGLIAGLGTGFTRPSLMGLISQAAPPSAQGVVIGSTQSMQAAAMTIGGPLSGFLINSGMLSGYALITAAIAAIGGLLAVLRKA